jgi:hypothetical protein
MFSSWIVAAVLVGFAIILRVIKTIPVDAKEGRDGTNAQKIVGTGGTR